MTETIAHQATKDLVKIWRDLHATINHVDGYDDYHRSIIDELTEINVHIVTVIENLESEYGLVEEES